MANLGRHASPIAVTLASLLLWGSFAWALPADTEASEGDAESAAEDPWAGVKISDAYDYAKCPQCGKKNEIRAETCYWCRKKLPQPDPDMTDPDMVFVPGKGYYREGTLLEWKNGKSYWVTGLVLTVSGLAGGGLAGYYGGEIGGAIAALPCLAVMAVGVVLFIKGVKKKGKPVYAFTHHECFEPYERPAFARRPPDSYGPALKVEVTLLSF